jgi:D-alanine--poly(phosphoribitol) ligase subunit 2
MPDVLDIAARIQQFLSVRLHLDIPSADMDLFETGALDSLAFVELLFHLEREFGIRVSLDELELDHFRTIGRIAQFVLARDGQTSTTAWWKDSESPTQPR